MNCEMTQIVLPGDTNNMGTAFGGKIMQWIDVAAAIAARRFAKGVVVTASIDSLEFKRPIKMGDIVTLRAHVNRSWESSMEVGVKVSVEGDEGNFQACRAYLTFVALDDEGKRRKTPDFPTPVGARDWGWYNGAEERRAARLAGRGK